MKLSLYEVDAFADGVFTGNPAAVVPLQAWSEDQVLQAIAAQNNLSETAFYVEHEGVFQIRWFTPQAEVDLCGHGTLATAHVLISELGVDSPSLTFSSRSGLLQVHYSGESYTLDFPAEEGVKCAIPAELHDAFDAELVECYFNEDYLVIVDSEKILASLQPDFYSLAKLAARGVIVTAPGDTTDFVCRFFAPAVGIDEDPVTGSAFTKLIPYWSKRIAKSELTAKQISTRGGYVRCAERGDRVLITGRARTYLRGAIEI